MAGNYEVHDRGDVRDRLQGFGVDSVADIRRARGSRHHKLHHTGESEQLGVYATGSPNELAANVDALTRASGRLAEQAHAVDELIAEAKRLLTPMHDGHGPIARAMRPAFHERADDTSGVLRALTEYQAELNRVRAAVQRSLETYAGSEQASARRLTYGGSNG